MSVQDTADAVLEKFPHPKLDVITGDGDYPQLYNLRKQVYQNLVAIPCPYGTGTDGHLGLGMSAVQYELRTGSTFTVPDNPGTYDDSIASSSGSVLQARKEAEHKEAVRAYKTCKTVELVTKKLLKKALPPALLIEIEDEILGLNEVSIVDIFDHCFDRRGHLTDTLIEENLQKADEPFDLDEGMPNYIKRLEQCQQLASDAGEAWTDAQLVRRGQTAMGKSGFFRDEYKEWLRRSRPNRTWHHFKNFWQQRFAEYQELNKLTASDSKFEANTAYDTAGGNAEAINNAMDNLAVIMSSDKNAVDTLVANNAKLTEQVQSLTATIERLTIENANLIKVITNIAGASATPPTSTQQQSARESNFDPNGYCWTHGYKVHKNHTSATCKRKAPGHQDAATRENPMGGSTKNKDWIKQ